MAQKLQDKIKILIDKYNKVGIKLPMISDPKTGEASVSLTMLVISFNVFLFGLIGKISGLVGGIDLQQALYWNVLNASLYFGRSLSLSRDGNVTNEEKEK